MRSCTSRTASPGTSEAVCPSGPRPRWITSIVAGRSPAYSAAAASRSSSLTGIGWITTGSCGPMLSRRCVRLRAGSPSGAMRSSTWYSSTDSHGIVNSARSANIAHGERPPLTASEKTPRAATAARASSATRSAAACATAAASGNTISSCCTTPSSRRARRTRCAWPTAPCRRTGRGHATRSARAATR